MILYQLWSNRIKDHAITYEVWHKLTLSHSPSMMWFRNFVADVFSSLQPDSCINKSTVWLERDRETSYTSNALLTYLTFRENNNWSLILSICHLWVKQLAAQVLACKACIPSDIKIQVKRPTRNHWVPNICTKCFIKAIKKLRPC